MDLPPIYCPIPPAVHPSADIVDRRAVDWMHRRGLCPNDAARATLARANCGGLVGRLFPAATDRALEAITRYFCWAFVLDDIAEAVGQRSLLAVVDRHLGLIRVLDAPDSAVLADDPFADAFREIHAGIAALASPALCSRWVELNRGFVLGVLCAAAYRQADAVPSPDTVTLIRPRDAGAFSFGIGLIEVTGGFEVVAEELARPQVRVLVDIASVLLAWDNDIYSYLMEARRDVRSISLVSTLAAHRGLDARAAMAEAIRMRNRAMHCYLRHRDRLPRAPAEPLHRYLCGLDHQIRGNLDWGLHATCRYASAGNGSLTLREQPADGDDLTEPVDLPSIRWWWDFR